MPINGRNKGANGEREIALQLNGAIGSVMRDMGFPDAEVTKGFTRVQRNQNQSAVGGKDLVGTFDLAIEVKRCEVLYVSKWWGQACASAIRDGEKPVLLFRQNKNAWRCMMFGHILLPDGQFMTVPVEIGWDEFYNWFKSYARLKLGS